MDDDNNDSGKYTCPECGQSFGDGFTYGRHVKNEHPGKKHMKAIVRESEEPKEMKADFDRVPADDFDQLEIVLINAGIKRGKAQNIRTSMESYEPDNLSQLAETLRLNGINKSTTYNVLSSYSSRLMIDFPVELKERLKLTEYKEEPDNDKVETVDDVVEQMIKRRALYLKAQQSGFSDNDLKVMFPEFRDNDPKPSNTERRKKFIFPPTQSGQTVELTDSEYATLYNQWLQIQKSSQPPVSDLQIYQEISDNLKSLGLNSSQRPAKEEIEIQMLTKSMDTISKRLDKVTPMATILEGIVEKLNNSGKLGQVVDGIMSRFENRTAPRPAGQPIQQYSESDFQKMNQQFEQVKTDAYSQQGNGGSDGNKQNKSGTKQSFLDHTTGKTFPFDVEKYREELKKLKVSDDEISQIIINVKGEQELQQVVHKVQVARSVSA